MENCIFCKIISGEIPSYKIYEDEYVYAFLTNDPVAKYHSLVIPKNHSENMFDISDEDARNLMSGVKKVSMLLQTKLGINNIQIVQNNGKIAQQEIFHIHYHLIPRSEGDGADIVIPDHPEYREEFATMIEKLQ